MKPDTALRALELMRSAPSGCALHPVTDDDTEPHLHCGEFAVVDLADREPVVGELYVFEQDDHLAPQGRRRRLVQVCRFGSAVLADGTPALFVGPCARNKRLPGYGAIRMVDGAFDAAGLRSQLVGRVVGVLKT